MNFCVLFLVLASAFFETQGKYTDILRPCPIDDGECQRQLFQKAVPRYAAKGVPELDIPILDPLTLNNITTIILGLVDITLVDGVAKGIKGCIFEKMSTDIENERAEMEVRCNLTIKGNYKLQRSAVPFLFGDNTLHAEGRARVYIENLRIKLGFNFTAVKGDDGEIRLKCKTGHFDYAHEFGNKVIFDAEDIYLGQQDISGMVVRILNESWKIVANAVGKPFIEAIMAVIQDFDTKFFSNVPARYYISDNLEKYIS